MKIKISLRKTLLKEQRKLIWQKADVFENKDPNEWRIDPCGACINWNEFKKRTKYGWNVDHILPKAKGGTDMIHNLCAMHWKNNNSKCHDFPKFKTAVSFNGTENVECTEEMEWDSTVLEKLKETYYYTIKKYEDI